MTIARIVVLASAGFLAGCTMTTGETPAQGGQVEARSRDVPAARATGPAESCIRLAEVTNSRVRNDWTIDFERASSRQIYRAELDRRCPGLKIADAFTYNTSLTQFCTSEIIYPLHQGAGGPYRGPACGINRFIPMELAP
jgi:tRNA U34 5-carboxymethylaminomethyl modifying enzyme MnmG/GidA